MRNGVMMNQSILFHKLNRKMRSKKKIDHFIPQTKKTKHTVKDLRASAHIS
jgi:hypothetical protein